MNAPNIPIRQKVSADLERTFITALITNRQFAVGSLPFCRPELFRAAPAQRAAQWCLDFTRKQKEAIGINIKAEYEVWVDKHDPEPSEIEDMRDFLAGMDEAFDARDKDAPPLNATHLLAEFADYTNGRNLENFLERANTFMQTGHREEALKEFNEFKTVTVGSDVGFDPFDEAEAACTEEEMEILIEWPGAAKYYLDHAFHRSSLIGIQAPGKRGKTFLCLEVAYRAIRCRRKVAFFQTGDLDKGEMKHRLYARVAQTPVSLPRIQGLQPGEFRFPVSLELRGEGIDRIPDVGFEIRNEGEFSNGKLLGRMRRFKGTHKINHRGQKNVMFSVHYNNSINVAGIEAILDQWKNDLNFEPDVIIVDYADIMSPEPGAQRESLRDRQNITFQAFRRLSQKTHACVVVPTQADAAAHDAVKQNIGNFSNDQRKSHHMTALLAIDQTVKEREMQVTRLNWLMLRGQPIPNHPLYITQCLPLGMALCQCAL